MLDLDTLKLIGRTEPLFAEDLAIHDQALTELVNNSTFLVVGGAGSIGQAVVKEIFKRRPLALHVVDISENNLVELVRDIRSSLGYIEGDFKTFAIDCAALEFDAMFKSEGPYNYILNLSALKHVRSEKDPYTLMRMIAVNIINTAKLQASAIAANADKFFCVSTDKAANPVNMMGASKSIMEMFLARRSSELPVSTARFANVAFSDGSLLHGFNQRILKRQPLAAPQDVKRYFITPQESGELCLLACLLGDNLDIFFPKLNEELHLTTFAEIAERYLYELGYEPLICTSEDEARKRVQEASSSKKWPCYFFDSDTTGEKDFEEFYTGNEVLDLDRYKSIGVIKQKPLFDEELLRHFLASIRGMHSRKNWSREEIITLFIKMLPAFSHKETGKFLDGRM